MTNILVLGAGKSSPSLISYLLEHADQYDWSVTVADLDKATAEARVGGHPGAKPSNSMSTTQTSSNNW